jgi:hypothetical protein
VLDPGAAPRTVLAVEAPDTTTLLVVSADSDETVIGSDRLLEDRTATFELLVTIDPEGSGFRLVAEPTLEAIEMPNPPDLSRLAPLVTTYDRNGLQVGPTSSRITDLTRATKGLVSTPGLVLAVPESPVGVGARWSIAMNADGSSQAFVTLIDVSADGIDVEVAFESTSDEATYSMISSGTYDRDSLVARSVRTVVTMVIDTTVTANGENVEVNDSRQSVRTYEQVDS